MPGRASAGPNLSFSQSQRIKLGWEFDHVRRSGSRLVKGCLVLNYLIHEQNKQSRLGVITSRKIGNAVARSRARRLIREAFRLHQHHLSRPADLVLIARPSIAEKDFAQVQKDYLFLLREARLATNPVPTPAS